MKSEDLENSSNPGSTNNIPKNNVNH